MITDVLPSFLTVFFGWPLEFDSSTKQTSRKLEVFGVIAIQSLWIYDLFNLAPVGRWIFLILDDPDHFIIGKVSWNRWRYGVEVKARWSRFLDFLDTSAHVVHVRARNDGVKL